MTLHRLMADEYVKVQAAEIKVNKVPAKMTLGDDASIEAHHDEKRSIFNSQE